MGIERLSVRGIDLEVLRKGHGSPILLLHGLHTVDPEAPFLDLLAARAEIIAPSHPGFGHSPRPADFDTVYDLVHLYLDLLEQLHERVTLMGLSFGGWLAAEIAAARSPRVERLILVDAVGIKVGDRETPDILDVFNTSPAEVRRRRWHEPAKWAPDPDALSNEALIAHARNREALCLYAWHPYMYNPRLTHWLNRVAVPTLVVWGEEDQLIPLSVGKKIQDGIPDSSLVVIDGCGHLAPLECSKPVAEATEKFLRAPQPVRANESALASH